MYHRLDARANSYPEGTGGYVGTDHTEYNYRGHTRHLLHMIWSDLSERWEEGSAAQIDFEPSCLRGPDSLPCERPLRETQIGRRAQRYVLKVRDWLLRTKGCIHQTPMKGEYMTTRRKMEGAEHQHKRKQKNRCSRNILKRSNEVNITRGGLKLRSNISYWRCFAFSSTRSFPPSCCLTVIIRGTAVPTRTVTDT